jgi:hypothetical protein
LSSNGRITKQMAMFGDPQRCSAPIVAPAY